MVVMGNLSYGPELRKCCHGLLFIAAFSSLMSSCSRREGANTIYMPGSIREGFEHRLLNLNKPHAKIIVSSSGGLPSSALISAYSLRENENNLIIQGVCFSACAEYLLPAAQTVEFRNEPLIGFHWNAMMIKDLMKKNATRNIEFCTFLDAKKLNSLQRETGVNNDFWKHTLIKLGKHSFYVDYKPNMCPWKNMSFEHRIWLPTSTQLRELYELQFTGNVCADNYEKCKIKINRRWKKGARIVVGDQVYISKGYK